jgi:hypothetical protein
MSDSVSYCRRQDAEMKARKGPDNTSVHVPVGTGAPELSRRMAALFVKEVLSRQK